MLPSHNNSEFNRTAFQAQQMKAKTRTMIPVRVVKVYKQDGKTEAKRGEVAGAGFVDVQPVVSQVDGAGTRMDHTTVYHIPFTRAYGGDFAIISDPVKGDIGYIHAADRDISVFKDQIRQGDEKLVLPASQRRHDMTDSLYMGGVLNKTPKQYLTASDSGITITSGAGSVTITAKNGNKVVLDNSGNVQVTPGSGKIVYLGGTGSDGSYDFVETVSGPSTNVKARIG